MISIAGRPVGRGAAVYIIAELGVNHDGSVARALEMVDAAAEAGADAIKMQLFEAERLMSRASRLAGYQAAAGEKDPVEMLRRLELSIDEMSQVVERAHAKGLHAIVTPFSLELIDVAERLAWDAYKTASPDVINRPLLDRLAKTGKPFIVSTGAATLEECQRAVGWLQVFPGGCITRVGMLQCVSSYPCVAGDASIAGMVPLARLEGFMQPVGYSDHTVGIDTGAAAVNCSGYGATILEKHLTWSNSAAGPDHAASLEPGAFRQYATLARDESQMRVWMGAKWPGPRTSDERYGPEEKRVLPCEADVRRVSRQSVVTTRELKRGEVIGAGDVTIKRPGTGIEPWRMGEVVGRRVGRDVEGDMPLVDGDLD